MKKAISILIFFLIPILFISSFPSNTSACSCVEMPSVEEEFERSQAVFSGKVLSIKGNATKSVLFEVMNTWKGVEQSQIIIETGQGGGDCGIDFKLGHEYLVYAYESKMYGPKSLITVICDRTNELSILQEDLEILGEGQPPIEEVDLTKFGGNKWFIWGGVVLAIGGIFIFILRKCKRWSKLLRAEKRYLSNKNFLILMQVQ